MPLFRALAKNMAPMTNADECWRITDESPDAFLTEHFSLYSIYSLAIFRTSWRSSEVRCEVQKFVSEFTSQFVNKGCDWLLNTMKPIKCLVYKPACEFWNELLNFATNSRTSQRSSEYYSEKLSEIDCKTIGSPKIGLESFILMIEHILVSILFDLTRATLSLRNTLI